MIYAETVLQPSLHTVEEFDMMVIDEAESRGIDVSKLRATFDPEWSSECADEAITLLQTAGYVTVLDNDTFLIYPKGTSWDDIETDND
jgi:hypothetical protein